MKPHPTEPEVTVQRQLDAYNALDLDALMSVYADDIEVYEFPAKLLARGSASLRERLAQRFREPNLHAKLLHRIVAGSTVIDHECVTRTFPEGPGELDVVMIYEVAGGRIVKSWSIAGDKRLFAR